MRSHQLLSILLVLAIIGAAINAHPAVHDTTSSSSLGQLKAATHSVTQVSLTRSFRSSGADTSLLFKTLDKLIELNARYEEVVALRSAITKEEYVIATASGDSADGDVELQSLEVVLWDTLKDGCMWAKVNFKVDSLNCSKPDVSLQKLHAMVNTHVSATSLYAVLGKYQQQPMEDYNQWVKTHIFCDYTVTDQVSAFVINNYTPFLNLRGKERGSNNC